MPISGLQRGLQSIARTLERSASVQLQSRAGLRMLAGPGVLLGVAGEAVLDVVGISAELLGCNLNIISLLFPFSLMSR